MAFAAIKIEERSAATVGVIGEIPIAFRVERIFEIERRADGSIALREAPAPRPFVKDYDRIEGNAPAEWAEQFDLSNWGLLAARDRGELVGSVLIAFDTPGLDLLEGRRDLGSIWDIRVRRAARRMGVGSALIRAAEDWSWSKGCTELKVETQTINVGACRLYARSGFRLRDADEWAYPEFPNETQLIWTKRLTRAPA